MSRKRRSSYLLASAAIPLLIVSHPLVAQEATEQQNEGVTGQAPNSMIIVTAGKREQLLQDTPLSITAISEEEIEIRGIEDFSDYARGVPGLSFQSARPGQTRIALRGIPNLGIGETVSFYLDETPITSDGNRTFATDPAIVDIDRIEVLRGPQGTLYGSSSMGGTIRIITNKPDLNDFTVSGSGTLSSTDDGGTNYGANGTINVPLARGSVGFRGSVFYRDLSGYIDRIPDDSVLAFAALTDEQRAAYANGAKNINEVKIMSLRGALLWRLGNLSITPSIYVTRNDYRNQPGVNAAFGGKLLNTLIQDEDSLDRSDVYNLTATYDFNFGTLTSATSYVDRAFGGRTDSTQFLGSFFGNAPLSAFDFTSDIEIFTQEVRLVSTGTRMVDFVVGGFYYEFDEAATADLTVPGFSTTVGFPVMDDLFFRKDAGRKYYEGAIFGDLTYNVTDRLHVTAGVRVFEGSNSFFDVDQGFFNGGRTTRNEASASYNGYNPRFLVSFDATDDVMFYATASKGYRAGGANVTLPSTCDADLATFGLSASPDGYDSDSLWNYEAGAKTAFLNNRLTLNGAAYLIKWDDIQFRQNLNCGFSFLTNGGKASSRGFELEAAFQPVPAINLSAGFGYADAKLDDPISDIPNSKAGSPMPGVPSTTFTLSAIFTPRLSADLEGLFSTTYQYSSSFRTDLQPSNPSNQRSSVNNVGARLGVRSQRWNASLFVDNLLDERPVVGGNQFGSIVQQIIARPRTVGVRAGFDF